ncbi:MAG: PAS domain S-box protein [Acidobacteria bacterium]|nr:MAG: PAS domain S-box protein [Acidobacteriota bacterium]
MLKNRLRRVVAVILFLTFCCWSATLVQSQPSRRVLLLHSYHSGMTWVDDLNAGISQVLRKDQVNVYFQIEYMDTKHNSGVEYLEMLHELFRAKYAGLKFDVVITADDAAFHFVREHRQEMFHGAPVVFCGLNDYSPEILEGMEDVTGIVEQGDVKSTLDLAVRLHPRARQLAIITDNSDTGRTMKAQVERVRKQLNPSVQLVFLDNLPLTVIADRLSLLPADSVVYLGPYTVDLSGVGMDPASVVRTLRLDQSSLPVYTTNRSFLGRGLVGGYVISGVALGKRAAGLALRILNGEKAGAVPILIETPELPMFDYPQLERFSIALSELPAASVVLRQPLSFYGQFRNWILLALVFVGCQSALIVVLTLNIRKRKKAQEELRESEKKYRSLTSSLPEIVLELDRDARLTFMNQPGLLRLQYQPEDVRNRLSFFEIVAPTDRDRVREYLAMSIDGKGDSVELSMAARDGYTFPAIMRMNLLLEKQHLVGYRGLCFDISERKRAEEELKKLHDELEKRVQDRTFELARANSELRTEIEDKRQTEQELLESRKDLRRIAAHLETIREEENRRIAREIHDGLATSLTAAKVEADCLDQASAPERKLRIEALKELLNTVTEDVRRIARNLRPSLIEDFGLKAAVEWFCTDFRQRTGIRCSLSLPESLDCSDTTATALFRILQEALTNVTRHANATQVNVKISGEEETILLEIRDNGVGIDPGGMCRDTLGIIGMQERAIRLGGFFSITKIAEGGTMVAVRVPHRSR